MHATQRTLRNQPLSIEIQYIIIFNVYWTKVLGEMKRAKVITQALLVYVSVLSPIMIDSSQIPFGMKQ
jgi:hypothetical protein